MSTTTSSRRPILLALGAVGLIAAVIGLWLGLRGANDSGGTTGVAPARGDRPAGSAPPDHRAPGTERPPGAPVVSAVDQSGGTASESVRETVINGVRIRDHRANGGPIDLPPNIHPPDSRKLQPELIATINTQVFAIVRQCVADVPREARGTNPRLEGQIVVAIKHDQVAVVQSTMQLRDVVGAAVEPTIRCMEQRTVGVTVPAGGEQDVDSYAISLSYALP